MTTLHRPWRLALPMYNVTPALARAWETLLQHMIDGLRAAGWDDAMQVVAPPEDMMAFWRAPDTLLSQTCGFPLVTALGTGVRVLAVPEFDLPGCEGVLYRSAILVPQHGAGSLTQLRGSVAAVNQDHSHSGMNALRHTVAPLARDGRFFSSVVVSGGHLASMALLQRGQAAVAAVDCVTLGLAIRHAPERVAGLRLLQYTDAAPGLPLIASCALSEARVAQLRALLSALPAMAPAAMAQLSLRRFTPIALADYQPILQQAQFAVDSDYPVLA